MRFLDMDTWARKEHFRFFNNFDEPFWGVTAAVECSEAYEKAKAENISFFLLYLHKSVVAANRVEEFRYRIDGQERIVIHDTVNASPTIDRPDGSFGFSYIAYAEDFKTFERNAKKEIERVRNTTEFMPATTAENVIHYSSIPWIGFTALSHARNFSPKDSIPKISFGKLSEKDGKKLMPVSVHVHHGLVDGFHVGKYLNCFQELLNE
ncbi:MAG: chloramphenicol acetyltransferase [Sinomicrobium sp.]|nr:chloramphenicol acetyltransferase [Sinomicrobium sp.]